MQQESMSSQKAHSFIVSEADLSLVEMKSILKTHFIISPPKIGLQKPTKQAMRAPRTERMQG